MCIIRGLEVEGKVTLVTLVWHLPGVCLHVLRQQGGVMEHLAAGLALQARGVNLQYSTVQYSTVQYSTVQGVEPGAAPVVPAVGAEHAHVLEAEPHLHILITLVLLRLALAGVGQPLRDQSPQGFCSGNIIR